MALPLKVLVLFAIGYVALVVLAWRFQERVAFPAPRGPLPEPSDRDLPDGQRVAVTTADGVQLYGWFLPPAPAPTESRGAPGVLWFYGNAETVGDLAPIVRELRPPGTALLILDYRGYGESGGRTTERGLYLDARAAWEFLVARPEVDSTRIAVYGRSLGGVPAMYLATERPVRAVVLESPFTSARAMAREHYRIVPPFVLRLSMDNLARARRLSAPLLVFHGTADRVVPFAMGKAIADAAGGELVTIDGADHNETYVLGGAAYRAAVHRFLETRLAPDRDAQ
jgi:fermentation-respiration switch protein FrsA (DUF1100 family)